VKPGQRFVIFTTVLGLWERRGTNAEKRLLKPKVILGGLQLYSRRLSIPPVSVLFVYILISREMLRLVLL
jgi:hypothetical protein